MTAAERKRMVAERCARSPVWRVVHWLASLQLALVLLATIAIACAVATFTESGFSAKVAQAHIYKAPWFIVWLGVLCVNLLAVTISRWPWEKKHIGFIVTHYGIILLLAGAIVGLQTGFEGNVTLHKEAPPVSRVTTGRSIIQLDTPADTYLYLQPFDAALAKPSGKKSREFPVPGTSMKVVVDGYAPSLIRRPTVVPSELSDARPTILLRLTSGRLGQSIDKVLSLEGGGVEEDFFGLAKIRFASVLSALPPSGPAETRMVFAKYAPVSDPSVKASDVIVRLSEAGDKVGIFDAGGHGATYLREDIMKNPVTESGATVVVEEYWPHFAIEDGKPKNMGETPENPAILVRVSALPKNADPPALDLTLDGDGHVAYRLTRGGVPHAAGTAQPGVPFHLGWADWQAEVVAASGSAVVATEVLPGDAPQGMMPTPGFRAHLVGDGRGPDRWIESGEVAALTDGKTVVHVGYGLETRPLPFSMRLMDFEVPRDEGTETPSNFLATVEFRDAKTGETRTGVAQMNRPASFPGTLVANLTGINYKFSQAEWNPHDLTQTTLQVLYDPGWMLKWMGSLGICIGIAIQFYWKPRPV